MSRLYFIFLTLLIWISTWWTLVTGERVIAGSDLPSITTSPEARLHVATGDVPHVPGPWCYLGAQPPAGFHLNVL